MNENLTQSPEGVDLKGAEKKSREAFIEQYKKKHPDAIEDPKLAQVVAEATKAQEDRVQEMDEEAIKAIAEDKDPMTANKRLRSMRRLRKEIDQEIDNITAVYKETKELTGKA